MQYRYVLLRKLNRPSTIDYSLYIRDNVANYFLYKKRQLAQMCKILPLHQYTFVKSTNFQILPLKHSFQ